MKFSTVRCLFFIAVTCVLPAGCRRIPPPLKTTNGPAKGAKGPRDSFEAFLENVRFQVNPRSGDDWTRFRDGLVQLAPHFSRPEVVTQMRLSAEDRKFLQSDVHLTEAELAEIESPAFRTIDGHYLDECFLMRDAAKTLTINTLDPAQQAEVNFRWVMRNVMLHEQGDTWIPPAPTLRRGYGSAVERSLVFLALLRQAGMEGCLIVVPDTEPLQFLVAGFDAKAGELYLFDARLGRALKAKDGKRIVTLREALAEPALLQPSRITPEQAKHLQAWLVCPLYALAPRMLELQNGCSGHDSIALHLDARLLQGQIAKAVPIPVKVWNLPAQEKTLPNSPTRCLRMFVPKQSEDGVDETNRAEKLVRARVPLPQIMANLAQIKLREDQLPRRVFMNILGTTEEFFSKYDVQARELFLRGQYEALIRRQERLQAFALDDSLVGLGEDPAFVTAYAEWQNDLKVANANLEAQGPQGAKAQQALQKLLPGDQFIAWLLQLDKEDALDRKVEKTMMTKILAVGMRSYFDFELARARAMTGQERAERLQATLDASAQPTKSMQAKANEAWTVVHSAWLNFYVERISLTGTIDHRLSQIRTRFQPQELEMRIGLLEGTHLEIHKYFDAKLRLAECKAHLEGPKKAQGYLKATRGEIEELLAKNPFQADIKQLRDAAQGARPPFRAQYEQRLDLLARDWSETGAYAWMKRDIDLRISTKN